MTNGRVEIEDIGMVLGIVVSFLGALGIVIFIFASITSPSPGILSFLVGGVVLLIAGIGIIISLGKERTR